MQFLIVGLDGDDEQALSRRLAVRQHHIKLGDELLAAGNLWYGAALYNEAGEMNGSMYVMDFKDEAKLHEWLAKEPYVTGDVWRKVEIYQANVRDPWQFSRPREFFESRAQSSE